MAPLSLSGEAEWRGTRRPQVGELLVSEVFGPTLQGEGPNAGRAAAFVRLGGCHLACSWCDTPYTWDAARHHLSNELVIRRTDDVAAQALSLGAPLVVITGGEPALQAAEAARLADALNAAGTPVELETSGSLPLGPLAEAVRLVVASPKLTSSGLPVRARLRWGVLAKICELPHAVLKFVMRSPEELAEVDGIVARLGIDPGRIWVMPEGTEPGVVLERMAALATPVAVRGWSLSGRLHVLIWGNDRCH